jgi:sulfonate transport system substrate-binding protein
MKTIKIAGVPEHFNFPWRLAIDDGAFSNSNICLEWTDVPEGSGKMCNMLHEGEVDMAIVLTEGIVKAIATGNPSKIVQLYVASPLIWGIHVDAKSNYKSISDLKDTKIAISRYGSGSHLMAYINTQNQGWDTTKLQFEIVNHLNGAVEALTKGHASYFMWERFTTKPLVDQGIFRCIAHCPTPWPCFVIAVRNDVIEKNRAVIKRILELINTYTSHFKQIPNIANLIADRYEQKLEDSKQWLSLTHWSRENLTEKTVEKVQQQLLQLHLIPHKMRYEDMVTNL